MDRKRERATDAVTSLSLRLAEASGFPRGEFMKPFDRALRVAFWGVFVIGGMALFRTISQPVATVTAQAPLLRPFTLADITAPDTSAHAIATTGSARMLDVFTPGANAGNCYLGDSLVTATRGITLAPGASYGFRPAPQRQGDDRQQVLWDLSAINYKCDNAGDKLKFLGGL